MAESAAKTIERLVRLHAPRGAVGYALQRITPHNEVVRFPETGCLRLTHPFELPIGAAKGVYVPCYFRSPVDKLPMAPANPNNPYPGVPVWMQEEDVPSTSQAALPASGSPPKSKAALPASSAPPAAKAALPESGSVSDEMAEAPCADSADPSSALPELPGATAATPALWPYPGVQEVKELHALNVGHREEGLAMAETLMSNSLRTAHNARDMMALLVESQKLQTESLLELKKQLAAVAQPPPPPPPVDYSSTATAAVALLRDISVALIQLKAGQTGPAAPAQVKEAAGAGSGALPTGAIVICAKCEARNSVSTLLGKGTAICGACKSDLPVVVEAEQGVKQGGA